jgi:exopolysaccharide biosynthesis predicted pyruvyltransferase EpsI
MKMEVLVLGYYNKSNLGDQLFILAFQKLFPKLTFTFTDMITAGMVKSGRFGCFFIGGGSLLDGTPGIAKDAFPLLKNRIIAYIGVGAETEIHPLHEELLSIAKLIAIRNPDTSILSDRINNQNIISIPDLVYSLTPNLTPVERNSRLLFIPNFLVVPKHYDPYWKASAWQRAKFSIAEALDKLIEDKRISGVDCFSMSVSKSCNDANAMVEIANLMKYGWDVNYRQSSGLLKEDARLVSLYASVITQRYHGIILAEMAQTPHAILSHHDKLAFHSPKHGETVDYYSVSKHRIIETFDSIITDSYPKLAINPNAYVDLIQRVETLTA